MKQTSKMALLVSVVVLLSAVRSGARTDINVSIGNGTYVYMMPGQAMVVSTNWSSDNGHDVGVLMNDATYFMISSNFDVNGWHTRPMANSWDTSWSGGTCSGTGSKTDILWTDYDCSNGQNNYGLGGMVSYHLRKICADDEPDECPKGDPVMPIHGSLMERIVDIPVGTGAMMNFERIYDSRLSTIRMDTIDVKNTWRWPLGMYWTHNYNMYVMKVNNMIDTVWLYDGTRTRKLFVKANADSVYLSKNSDPRSLKYRAGPGVWVLQDPEGRTCHFRGTGQIDTLVESTGQRMVFFYDAADSLLDSLKDVYGNVMSFEYDASGKMVRERAPSYSTNGLSYEYRYTTYTQLGGAYKFMSQAIKRTNAPTADSLLVAARYYYSVGSSIKPHTGLLETYSMPGISNAADTNWAANRFTGAMVNYWYKDRQDTCHDGNPIVYQEMVSDSASGSAVVYRAFFKYYWPYSGVGDNKFAPDSVQIFFYEDTTSANAHNPLDTLFSPADSAAPAFGVKYYVNTIRYNTTRTKAWERYYSAVTGDTSQTTYSGYDKNYHPWTVTDPNGGVTNYTYATYQDPYDPDSTRYMDSPSKVKYPNGDSVMTYLSVKGGVNRILPDSSRDELGNRTWQYYDASKDYLDTAVVYKTRVLADGDTSHHDVTTRYHYSSKYGNLTETLDPLGHKTRMYYAPGDTGSYLTQQRVVMSSDTGSTDIVTKYGYNTAAGTLDTMTFYRDYPNNPSYTYYYYDQFNRIVKTVYPDTAKDSTVNDLRGNVLKRYTIKTDTLAKTEYEYSPRDLVTKVREYRQPKDTPAVYDSTLYYYNLHDRLVKQVNQLGKATTYVYAMDRLLKITYPDTTNDSVGYYADGSLKFKRDRKGQVIEYVYDGTSGACGCPSESRYRLVSKRYYDTWAQFTGTPKIPTDTVHYDYDAVGNRVKMVDKLGTTQYAYDGLYRLQSDSCGYLNTKVMYQYDQAGNRTRMKVCNGDTSSVYLDQQYKGYDNANRADTVKVTSANYVFSYWDTGTPKTIYYPHGVDEYSLEEYYLTNRGFVDSVRSGKWDDGGMFYTGWFKNKYAYNGQGDRTSQYAYLSRPGTSALTGTIYYSYNGLRRLTKVKNPAGFNGGDSIRYVYDKAGNRTRKYRGSIGTDQICTYNQANDQLATRDMIPYLEDPYTYSYDDNGNLTQSFDELGTRTYTYDFENRLTKVKLGSDSTVFCYNGDGVRLKKQGTKDSSLQYIHDGMYAAVERRTNGNLKYKYVYANGMLLARIDSAGTTYYYSHDALGSVIGASSSSAVYKSYLYDEFGDSLGAWGATSINNYRYTGQEYDITPVNAYNLRAREYYSKLGRFMQNDPIGDKGGSLNWYTYVANNPINYVDVTGLECCTDCGKRLATFASQAAIRSGLGGIHNGLQDAFRHCFWSCWMAIQCGLMCAEAVGFGHELDNVFNDHEPFSEFNMDMYNNAAGRICSRSMDCHSCCMERALHGRLKVLTATKK